MQFEDLVNDLKKGIGLVRVKAATELGRLGEKRAIPALIEALKDPNMALRNNAAFALGEIGAEEAVPRLIDLLRDPEERVRKSAIKALGMIRAKDAVAPLLQVLDADNSRVTRKSALRSLGQIGDPKALGAVERFVSHPDPALADAAKKAVEVLKKQ
jgi:HEAT repeat protein